MDKWKLLGFIELNINELTLREKNYQRNPIIYKFYFTFMEMHFALDIKIKFMWLGCSNLSKYIIDIYSPLEIEP